MIRILFAALLTTSLVACGGGGGGGGGLRPATRDDFSITANPSAITLGAGRSTQVELSFTNRDRDRLYVELSVPGCPDEVECVTVHALWVEGTVTSSIYIGTTTSTPPGSYNFLVRGTTSGPGASTSTVAIDLEVLPASTGLSFSIREYADGSYNQGLALADFNGDGSPEIAYTSPFNESLTILSSDATGLMLWGEANLPRPPGALAIGNLNGDATPDIFMGATEPPSLIALPMLPGGPSTPSLFEVGDATFDFQPAGLVVLDADGNGTDDLAVSSYCTAITCARGLGVWLGDGSGSFTLDAGYATDVEIRNLAAGDIDGDGLTDLVAVVEASLDYNLVILQGTINGQFTPAQPLYSVDKGDSGSNPVGNLVIADFNGDFMPDIAVSKAILFGTGATSFAAPQTLPYLGNFTAGDLNGDGLPDLVGSTLNTMMVALNLGGGMFEDPASYSIQQGGAQTRVADMNNDGTNDVVILGNNRVTVMFNDP